MDYFIKNITLLYLLFLVVTCPLFGQVNNKKCFERITNHQINDQGNAIVFKTSCDKQNLMILKSLKSESELKFEGNSYKTELTNRSFYILNTQNKQLCQIRLEDFKIDTLEGVDDFIWIEEQNVLLTYNSELSDLGLYNEGLKKKIKDYKASMFSLSNDKKNIITIFDNKKLGHLILKNGNAKNNKTNLHLADSMNVKKIFWNELNTIAYLLSSNKTHYSLHKFFDSKYTEVFKREIIDSNRNTIVDTLFTGSILINEDKLTIGLKKHDKKLPIKTSSASIWSEKESVSSEIKRNILDNNVQLGIINLNNGELYNFFNHNELQNYCVNYNTGEIYKYESNTINDFTRLNADIQMSVFDEKNNDFKNLGRFKGKNTFFYSSKQFPYLFSLEDGNVLRLDTRENSTEKYNYKDFKSEEILKNNQSVDWNNKVSSNFIVSETGLMYFYDSQNIFSFNNSSNKVEKIFSSSTLDLTFNIISDNYSTQVLPWSWNILNSLKYDDLVLKIMTSNRTVEGIGVLVDGKFNILFKNESRIYQLKRSKHLVSFIVERANEAPSLYTLNIKTRELNLIYRNDRDRDTDKEFLTEYISWENEEGKQGGAIIRFPRNYNPCKSYPAIFNIYEKKYPEQHYYQNLFDLNGAGFTNKIYTNDGYFVIEPDIYYELGYPGFSATESVLEVLEKVEKKYPIDRNNLGIFGHSFGGYETNFIITQTNRFKAAVSGSGVADLTSWYLNIDWNSNRPSMWRIENQQFRMDSSLFENYNGYLQNSPIFHSSKIKTPLLLWSGRKDNNVDWNQSVAMYLALKRQNKEVSLILYPDEYHVLTSAENRLDLNMKIKEWFDFYLKGMNKPIW